MNTNNNINTVVTENYLRELVFILSVRKWLISFVILFVMGFVVAATFLLPPSYTTHAKVMVSRKAVETSLGTLEKVDYRIQGVTKEDLNSEGQLLLSEDLITKVVKELNNEGIMFTGDLTQERALAEQVAAVKASLVVEAIPYSKVLDLSFTRGDAKEATVFLTRLIKVYQEYRIEMQGYGNKREFFVDLTQKYLKRMKDSNIDLANLMKTNNVVSPDAEIRNNLDTKFRLKNQLSEGELKEIELRQNIKLLERKLKEKDVQFFSFLENEAITQFSRQIQELFIKKAKVEGVFVSKSKAVQGMNMQLKKAYKNLLIEVRSLKSEMVSQLKAFEEQNQLLRDKINQINQRNTELKLTEFSMEALKKESKVLEISFQTFYKRQEEAKLASNEVINESNISILAQPQFPLSPSFPNKGVLIPFGFIVACISGLIVGFLVEFFDHTFKRPEDIVNLLGMRHLLSINNI